VDNNNPVVDGVYAHINNGGVSFCVTNESGPTVNIQASHFGHLTNHIQLHMSKDGLKKLGEMFIAAAEYEGYSPDYVCAAETKFLDKDTGKVIPGLELVQNAQAQLWTPSN
jgi:hypothetical protein